MTSLELIVITSSLLGLCASFLYYGLVVKEQNKVKLSQLRLDQIKFINARAGSTRPSDRVVSKKWD